MKLRNLTKFSKTNLVSAEASIMAGAGFSTSFNLEYSAKEIAATTSLGLVLVADDVCFLLYI